MKKKELLKRIEALEKQVNSMRALQVANACIDAAKSLAEISKRVSKVEHPNPKFPKGGVAIGSNEILNDSEEVILPSETSVKFKRIADHANAITNEIATLKEDVIYVPDGVLEYGTMAIINGKQILIYDEYGWNVYACSFIPNSKPYQFILEPCKREDLKAGDVAIYYIPDGDTDINREKKYLSSYCIVSDKGIVFWSEEDSGITVCNYKLNSDYVWYKVVEA